MKKAVGPHLLLAIAATVVPLLGLEAALRHGLVDPYRQFTREYNPGVRLNGPKDAGTVRIVALGDSMTAGRDGYPRLLERRLAALAPGPSYQVLNLAVPGVDPSVYYKRLITIGQRWEPAVILVGVYVGNDIAGFRNPYDPKTLSTDLYYAMKMSSHLAAFIKTRLDFARSVLAPPTPYRSPIPPGPGNKQEYVSTVSPYLVDEAKQHPRYLLDTLSLSHQSFQESLAAMLATLRLIDRQCRSIRATALFIVIPAAVQIHQDYHPFYRSIGFAVSARLLTEAAVQEEMRAFFVDNGLRFLDLLPPLRATAREYFYYMNDDHWNGRAKAFVADLIARTLLERGLLGRPQAGERQ